MKKIIAFLLFLALSVTASAQVYDGITQPTKFRYWMPFTTSIDGTGKLAAAPFVGYKIQPADWISFTPVLQYNFSREAVIPQLWVNVNYQQKYYLLFRSIYDLKSETFSETVSGTVKHNKFMVDFTWDNFYRGKEFLEKDRLQILAGYAWKHVIFNAGYSIRDQPGFVSNVRFKLTNLSLGAKFYWFCLPIKHYNCVNRLENDESFICWEPGKESVWIKPMPKFEIRNHEKFVLGMTYQVFSKVLFEGLPVFVGLRMYESVQRLNSIADKSKSQFVYPIYDWRDNDIWLYLKLNNIPFPETYLYLYKKGVPVNKLRISQFFSIDTIKTLPKVLEFYPNLFEKIIRREPNADLVMLYWETDMFRSSRQDSSFDLGKDKDYRVVLKDELKKASQHPGLYPGYKQAKKLYAKVTAKTTSATCKKIYQILLAGDPKNRTVRVVTSDIFNENMD